MSKIKHIALLKFKEGTSEDQISELFDQMLDLSESVDGIEVYVSGPNNSSEGLNQGYSHAFVMTFKNSEVRDAYLAHPEHEKWKQTNMPVIDSVVVFDFEL